METQNFYEKLPSLLLRFLNNLKRTGRSSNTLTAYRNDLGLFINFVTTTGIQLEEHRMQEEWLHHLNLKGRKSLASVRRALMSVRTFLHFLCQEKIIAHSPFLEVKSPQQPKHQLLIVQDQHFETLKKTLWQQIEENTSNPSYPLAVRNLALLLILGECGLKASETGALTWANVLLLTDTGTVTVPGRSGRTLPMSLECTKALMLVQQVRGLLGFSCHPDNSVFFNCRQISHSPYSDTLYRHGIKAAVYEMCHTILGIPHNAEGLRNFAILKRIEQGLPPDHIAQWAGYSSLNSLERFSRKEYRSSKRIFARTVTRTGQKIAKNPL